MSYIVPMKKPICINCPFRNLDSCTLIYLMSDKDSEVTVHVNEMTVSPDCPLVEVKEPHGRLRDLDELKTAFPRCDNSMDIKIASVRATINHAPTIIEAEGREE